MKPIWSELTAYYARYAAVAVVVLGAVVAGAINSVSLRHVPPVQYNTYECATGGHVSAAVFRVLAYAESQAVQHADALCRDPAVRGRYGRVHVIWRQRDLNEVRIFFDQEFDLLLAKPEWVELKDIDLVDHYIPIAMYGDNTSKFVALDYPPELSADYFHGRLLGMLDNAKSVSGHQVPRQALRNAGIGERQLDIRYYETHGDLLAALLEREVDVVATGLALPEPREVFFVLPIQGGLKAPRWYLRPSLVDSPLYCHIAAVLTAVSASSGSTSARGLRMVRDCER
jgi:hypothetical protein